MLTLENVTKEFNLTGNKEDLTIALDRLNLSIAPGEFVTIIGGNGSGKSTTMNIITGVVKPTKGRVLLNNVDITNLTEYQRAAYFGHVFQDPMVGTSAEMSIIENLEIAYRRGRTHSPFKWGFKRHHKTIFIEELKRFDLGLENKLNQKVGLLSGGQRQALTLLMATMRNRPTIKKIRKDYILFGGDNKEQLRNEFDDAFKVANEEYKKTLSEISKKPVSQRISLRKEAKRELERAISKFDITQQILLLDEHTAALDPKTAQKVLELTDKIVKENNMTTLMVTHNMRDALNYGNRLIMFHGGHVIFDVKDEEKAKLTIEDLYKLFEEADKKALENA